LIVTVVFLLLAAVAMVIGLIITIWSRVGGKKTTIKVPVFGEVNTDVPAIGLAFVGLIFGGYGNKTWSQRDATYVTFQGNVAVDGERDDSHLVMVGITSGSWIQLTNDLARPITIRVPDSWPSYNAFAFAISGDDKVLPTYSGADLEKRSFTLQMKHAN